MLSNLAAMIHDVGDGGARAAPISFFIKQKNKRNDHYSLQGRDEDAKDKGCRAAAIRAIDSRTELEDRYFSESLSSNWEKFGCGSGK